MNGNKYLRWLASETQTQWWHDSADRDELQASLSNGAVGATTNPLLVKLTLFSRPDAWSAVLSGMPSGLGGEHKAESIMEKITLKLAEILRPIYETTNGAKGYACAQVNPCLQGNSGAMLDMAKRLNKWAPNISVKLPATAAGLDTLEECAALGIPLTSTVSFTVPQALAIGERYAKGMARAKQAGIKPAHCHAVLMVGRLDDYLRDVAMDSKSQVKEEDVVQSGLAVAKRAYQLFADRGYEAVIMPAALRGVYHMRELAGAKMVVSTAPKIQGLLGELEGRFEERIHIPIAPEVIRRLESLPEFIRAYEPNGMKPEEFIAYGCTQRTLSQFTEAGWVPLEGYKI